MDNTDFDTVRETLKDWYDQLPGCPDPNCLACKRSKREWDTVMAALKRIRTAHDKSIDTLREGQKYFIMSHMGQNPIPAILFVAVDTALKELGGTRDPLTEKHIQEEENMWGPT